MHTATRWLRNDYVKKTYGKPETGNGGLQEAIGTSTPENDGASRKTTVHMQQAEHWARKTTVHKKQAVA